MLSETSSQGSENSEEARALLQARLALFWKVMFSFMGMATLFGAVGAFNKRVGPDFFVDVALAAEAGSLWWLCGRGTRSVRFSRVVEGCGLAIFFAGGSLIGRFVIIEFARERALVTAEGFVMADAYLSVLGLVGSALMILSRAALVPSSPRRTFIYTALTGVPVVFAPTLLAPSEQGGLVIRAIHSNALPWMPAGLVIVWTFVVLTSTVVSRVIYGLRKEVREARRLGQYVLEQKIGEGGMGVVYRASHAMLRRPTAIKLLLPDRAGKDALTRFEREVRRTAMLTHPNTVTVFDYGRTTDGVFYYAMELLEGASLEELVEVDGPQPEERVIHLLEQAAASLAEAHDAGLIHRDVKPGNILVVDRGGISDLVKVVDFGLVKDVGFRARGDATSEPAVTMANTITGTPLYVAPETLTAPETVDARADLYALGAVGYWLLTGTHVFVGKTIVEVCAHHLHSVPDAPSVRLGAPVTSDLESVLLSCLAKRPEDRPASAHLLRERLRTCAAAGRWTSVRAAQWWGAHRHELRSGGAGMIAARNAVDALGLTVTRLAD